MNDIYIYMSRGGWGLVGMFKDQKQRVFFIMFFSLRFFFFIVLNIRESLANVRFRSNSFNKVFFFFWFF